MSPLALNIETSAEILNIAPEGLRQAIDEKEIRDSLFCSKFIFKIA